MEGIFFYSDFRFSKEEWISISCDDYTYIITLKKKINLCDKVVLFCFAYCVKLIGHTAFVSKIFKSAFISAPVFTFKTTQRESMLAKIK